MEARPVRTEANSARRSSAAFAMRAHVSYIYIRGEYLEEYESLQGAVDEPRQAGDLPRGEIVLIPGPAPPSKQVADDAAILARLQATDMQSLAPSARAKAVAHMDALEQLRASL